MRPFAAIFEAGTNIRLEYYWPMAKLQIIHITKVFILIFLLISSLPETFLMLNKCNTYVNERC